MRDENRPFRSICFFGAICMDYVSQAEYKQGGNESLRCDSLRYRSDLVNLEEQAVASSFVLGHLDSCYVGR